MALTAIDKALELEPDHTAWLLQRAQCFARLNRSDELIPLIDVLASRVLRGIYQYSTLALLMTQVGQREQALTLYQRAVELDPGEAKHYYNLATLQRSLGDVSAAEHNLDRAVALNPEDYEAYKIRSELRRQTDTDNHVDELEHVLERGIRETRGEVQVCFALAKELEDLSEYERSFQYLNRGATLKRRNMRYDINRDIDTMVSITEIFNAERASSATTGSDNTEAIFVLGLPRTGTTLVERVLSSHSEVFAAGELNNFALQMTKAAQQAGLSSGGDRDALVRAAASLDFRKLGDAYIESTRPFTGHTPRFIDKMPLNYLYLGLIKLALPNAKIISLRRHPLDTCYAIYKQLFVDAYPFSYDLEELGHYYLAYHQLMSHWDSVYPGAVHSVQYETLVDNFEHESRELLAFCGLDWQQQCLEFYNNKSASVTASTVQIRQPVYQSSVGKWRLYREQLAPLVRIFEDAGIDVS
ncbi:sulfotransferase [Luminiphilus syltensis NOR5-1B]|uniref:Sulfotransferase n=1 Tax=Luminiphilus syltensis NOR5-1B TaxID=565045 RepID=B8KTF9_9GAMM|nr:sulfotransferase [Luminiphilus syltensis NOR5-1B]